MSKGGNHLSLWRSEQKHRNSNQITSDPTLDLRRKSEWKWRNLCMQPLRRRLATKFALLPINISNRFFFFQAEHRLMDAGKLIWIETALLRTRLWQCLHPDRANDCSQRRRTKSIRAIFFLLYTHVLEWIKQWLLNSKNGKTIIDKPKQKKSKFKSKWIYTV